MHCTQCPVGLVLSLGTRINIGPSLADIRPCSFLCIRNYLSPGVDHPPSLREGFIALIWQTDQGKGDSVTEGALACL